MESIEYPIIVENGGHARKSIRNPLASKRNRAKIATYKPKKPTTYPSCSHKSNKLQCKHLSEMDVDVFAGRFYKSRSKTDQDSYILTYCVAQPLGRTDRCRKNGSRKKISIGYTLRKADGKLVKVCQKTFSGALGIGKARIQRVCERHVRTGEAPRESRGGDSKKSKFFAKKNSVITFIQKFRCVEVHYCRGKSKRQYLPSELSINKMYAMYCEQVKDPKLQVKSSYFRFVLNTKFNIGFKSPATDVCSTCTMLKEAFKLEKDPIRKRSIMNRLVMHRRRAKAFFKLLRDGKPNTIQVSIDCQKNMAVPKLFDQAAYFSRQISFNNFGAVVGTSKSPLTKDNVFLYVWGEYELPKGSNEIASALYHLYNLVLRQDYTCSMN